MAGENTLTLTLTLLTTALIYYLTLVHHLRHRRMHRISSPFNKKNRSLSSMTTLEAHKIITQLQELEFPSAFNKARRMALLKAGGIPSMSKLFAATGQNNRRNAGKRAVDTEILLREAQSKSRDSERYAAAVARMNYLHARYRQAGKITDPDLLHTLGDGLAEILTVIAREEWRPLTPVEKCALGIFHRNLGEDMGIPFDVLPSCASGWTDGVHFADELVEWTVQYESHVAKPTATNDQYVRVYVDLAIPRVLRGIVRGVLGGDLDSVMRGALGLEEPGPLLSLTILTYRALRRFILRYLALPRPLIFAVKLVAESPNPMSRLTLYNFQRKGLQPWYMAPTLLSRWGPVALLVRAVGGKVPGHQGERYQPQGYDLMTIGPEPQRGKGGEEMMGDMGAIMARGVAGCPFSRRNGKEV
ncbi:hypothetical protein BJY04DRAFT_206350 [Aspergillus karnatakaensis]|uniref:uncharacterized protein n=1 Tax=Aspergillus karnatakaensis TaxID=1810916 RepID=UPI003CCCFE9E